MVSEGGGHLQRNTARARERRSAEYMSAAIFRHSSQRDSEASAAQAERFGLSGAAMNDSHSREQETGSQVGAPLCILAGGTGAELERAASGRAGRKTRHGDAMRLPGSTATECKRQGTCQASISKLKGDRRRGVAGHPANII
jgi:hypothetical protein